MEGVREGDGGNESGDVRKMEERMNDRGRR